MALQHICSKDPLCVCVCVCFGYNTTNNRVERRGTAGHYSTCVAKVLCVCVCVCVRANM